MSTVPPGVAVIKFRDQEKHGWYGLVLATKDDNAKVFRAAHYDLVKVERAEFSVMADNPVPKAAKLWAESIRGATMGPVTRTLLEKLASMRVEESGAQHATA